MSQLSLDTLISNFEKSHDKQVGIRLGQYFCNKYIKSRWPELYYCEDEAKSKQMIVEWLSQHCYETELPREKNHATSLR